MVFPWLHIEAFVHGLTGIISEDWAANSGREYFNSLLVSRIRKSHPNYPAGKHGSAAISPLSNAEGDVSDLFSESLKRDTSVLSYESIAKLSAAAYPL